MNCSVVVVCQVCSVGVLGLLRSGSKDWECSSYIAASADEIITQGLLPNLVWKVIQYLHSIFIVGEEDAQHCSDKLTPSKGVRWDLMIMANELRMALMLFIYVLRALYRQLYIRQIRIVSQMYELRRMR